MSDCGITAIEVTTERAQTLQSACVFVTIHFLPLPIPKHRVATAT